MAGGEPEKGDKVSWNWGGGAPGGTVAEKKTEGEIAITSKKGNTIKKKASKDNPAVHIARSGNDVVKRVSELNVPKKAGGGGGTGGKRKGEADEEKKEDKIEKNYEGKEVRAGGKKQKKEDTREKNEDKVEEEDEKKHQERNGDKPKANEKKKAGRSKNSGATSGTAKKEKKPSKPRSTGTVSARTRSQNR